MDIIKYKYAIIGAGCAGMHLALAMLEDPYFSTQDVLVIEKEKKNSNDRTWCFWEQGEGNWDQLIDHSWSKGKFYSSSIEKDLRLHDYQYKKLRSIDFYTHAKSKIEKSATFHWIQDEVLSVNAKGNNEIVGKNDNYIAEHIFDSRIDPDFYQKGDGFTRIMQHFKGWEIETEEDAFDPDTFIIMDFRLKYKDSTSFNYVLPTSPRKALVEFTLFTPELIEDQEYDRMLDIYVKDYLNLSNYTITEVEKGIIPMSDYPFHKHHKPNLTKIGTAGSWVRPSTGYSFKNSERYSQLIIDNIKAGRIPSKGIAKNRFRQYDKLLLHILKDRNELGESLFTSMFGRNSTKQIFKFLDEDTTLLEDARIISSFRPGPFLKALFKRVLRK